MSNAEIPDDIMNAASMAAFPGLPEGVSLDEANRRVAAALETTWPLIERYWRVRIAGEVTAAGSPTSNVPAIHRTWLSPDAKYKQEYEAAWEADANRRREQAAGT